MKRSCCLLQLRGMLASQHLQNKPSGYMRMNTWWIKGSSKSHSQHMPLAMICHRYLDQKVGKAFLSLLPSDILLFATLFKLSSTWSRTWSTCAEVAQTQDSLDDIPAALSRSHCRSSARLLDSSLVLNTSIDPFKSSLTQAISVCIRRRL